MDELKPQFIITVTGPKNSGKTTWLRELITDYLLDMFPRIIVMSPTLDLNNDFSFLEEQTKSDYILADNPDEYESILTKAIQLQFDGVSNDNVKNLLIVLDDCATEKVLQPNSLLDKFCIRHRHYKISFIIVGHKLRGNCGLPLGVRSQINSNIIFNPASMSELELLLKEAILSDHLKEAKAAALKVFSEKYNYLVFTPANVYGERVMVNHKEPLLSKETLSQYNASLNAKTSESQTPKKKKSRRKRKVKDDDIDLSVGGD